MRTPTSLAEAHPRPQSKWDRRFLRLAREVASWSKDPSTKVGAVIVRPDRKIASVGFNGFPPAVPDEADMLGNREVKLALTLHAEENAILHASEELDFYTIYVYPFQPCAHCAAQIISKGITRVVCYMPSLPERWRTNFELAFYAFEKAGVKMEIIGGGLDDADPGSQLP